MILPALSFIILVSCSTTQKRVEEQAEAFEQLPQEQKNAILKGKILNGMTADAVYMALGKPSRVVKNETEKGISQESWIYTQIQPLETTGHQTPLREGSGGYASTQQHDPAYLNRDRDFLEVKFENGKVVGWKNL